MWVTQDIILIYIYLNIILPVTRRSFVLDICISVIIIALKHVFGLLMFGIFVILQYRLVSVPLLFVVCLLCVVQKYILNIVIFIFTSVLTCYCAAVNF